MSEKKKGSWMKDMVAGGLAGCLEVTVMYPTEYVKTQLQLQTKGNKLYTGMLDCGLKTVKQHGVGGLYRGLTSLLIGTAPKASLRFTAFSQISKLLQDEKGKTSAFGTWFAGAMAGLIEATLVVTPVETMKTKLIADQNRATQKYRGLIHGITVVVKEEGIAGVYRGLLPTIAKQMGNQSIRFSVYSQLKALLNGGDPKVEVAGWKMMGAGFTAGAVSVFLTMPFDVVKTRMQGINASMYKSTFDCVRVIFTTEGIFAFWAGMMARLPRVAFGQSIALTAYDAIFKLLDITFP